MCNICICMDMDFALWVLNYNCINCVYVMKLFCRKVSNLCICKEFVDIMYTSSYRNKNTTIYV